MNRLGNKVALVTGAAGGIGAAIAKLFAQEGAKVMATDVQTTPLNNWVKADDQGLTINYMPLDVSSESYWKTVVTKTVEVYGHIDILVNNAGIYPGFVDCEQTSIQQWQHIIDVNLTGPFLGCKTVIPVMKKSGGGSIVNIASIAGIVGGNGVAYSSSKGGLCAMGKDLAVTLAKDNIRVNTICPGGVRTPMTEKLLNEPEMNEMIRNMSPQGRVANAVEIAWGALFLASDESSYMTGAELVLDGGAVAR